MRYNLQEQIVRIKKLSGLNEQVVLPVIVSGNYTATNCDELHAFQGTGGKVLGNMNKLVQVKIGELTKQVNKVKVTNVDVKVNGMNVSWSVTISESDDGKNWVGFTSRGAGCNNNITNRWDDEGQGNGINSIKDKIKSVGIGDVDKIELVRKFEYNGGENSFIQGFYRYCLVDNNLQQPDNQVVEIKGSGLNDLRNRIKSQTKDIMIDMSNWGGFDISELKLTVNVGGNTKVKNFSLVFDDVSAESLSSRINGQIKQKEPTVKVLETGDMKSSDKIYYYSLIVIPY
jgi:hypothetical protein